MTVDLLLGSITVRLTFAQLQKIAENSASNPKEKRIKPFADKSDCVRQILEIGWQTWELLQLKANPEKWNEFQAKMSHIVNTEAAKQVIETMTDAEQDSMIAFIKYQKDKRVEQKLLEIGGHKPDV